MDSFIGQIDLLPYTFTPIDYAFCNGALVPLSQYQALAAVIGTAFGGSAQNNTLGLPNLQGRTPVGFGSGPGLTSYNWAATAGVETVTLTEAQLPVHNHNVAVGIAVNLETDDATNAILTRGLSTQGTGTVLPYTSTPGPGQPQPLNANSLTATGQNQAHNNRQPFLVLNFCICLNGIFPVRN
ncbi:microcystin-dependent protein [Rheinheimera sp. A13L]|uniref:phage tail protein n=1 Tax=Rheinheimera sp. A13L TaxID=506534 RepID=UPI0002125059|nr:tail fiber protein [Rheinheimera sp. A13L]EGM76018.1 microcystin-dependent protein [Rheinheimera sp. A13L]